MEGGRVLFDASSYMLIESSGDSEAEYFDTAVEAELDAAAEDDAQSCICGWLSDSVAVHEIDAGGDEIHGAADFDDRIEEEEDDGGGGSGGGGGGTTEVEEGVVDQCCSGGGKVAAAELNESKACEDSNMKLMNDGETDRLFWEACLAS